MDEEVILNAMAKHAEKNQLERDERERLRVLTLNSIALSPIAAGLNCMRGKKFGSFSFQEYEVSEPERGYFIARSGNIMHLAQALAGMELVHGWSGDERLNNGIKMAQSWSKEHHNVVLSALAGDHVKFSNRDVPAPKSLHVVKSSVALRSAPLPADDGISLEEVVEDALSIGGSAGTW